MFRLEEIDISEWGPCDCCGASTCLATGMIHRGGAAYAAYQIIWTPGGVDTHGAEFFFFVGDWEDGSGPEGRVAVALHQFEGENGAGFMVVDAGGPLMKAEGLAGKLQTREEVIGTPLAKEVFDLVDFVWLTDSRISELTEWPGPCSDCAAAAEAAEKSEREGDADMDDPAFFDVPGFGDGISREVPASSTPPVAVLASVLVVGGVLLAGAWKRVSSKAGGDWTNQLLAGLMALAALLAIWKVTAWYRAGRKQARSGPAHRK